MVLSSVLLVAHFFRYGNLVPLLVAAALPVLLLVRGMWPLTILRWALLIGTLEWVRTAVRIAKGRMEWGQPWVRMALILGAVALFTLISAVLPGIDEDGTAQI